MSPYQKSLVPIKRANAHIKGRPKGSKNKKTSFLKDETPTEEIFRLKKEILRLFDERQVSNLSQAAEQLSISKMRVHSWRKSDPEFAKQLDVAEELLADDLEIALRECKTAAQVTAIIFLLKGLRPQKYRDNYKFEVENPKVQELLSEIKRLGEPAPEPKPKQISEKTAQTIPNEATDNLISVYDLIPAQD